MNKTQLAIGVAAAIIGILLFLLAGKLSTIALQTAYQSGSQNLDTQIGQIIASTEKECKPFDIGTAIILSKKCTEKQEAPEKSKK